MALADAQTDLRPGRATRRHAPRSIGAQAKSGGLPLLVTLYFACLIMPIFFQIGSLTMQPYRVLLLLAFFSLSMRFLAITKGRLRAFDWCIVGVVAWEALALLVNHGAAAIEPLGIQAIEVFGAYALGRVGVRSAEDFRRVVRLVFFITLLLLPFAVFEAITKNPILLKYIPNAPKIIWAPPRMGLRRAQAVFTHPILYGVFVSSALGLAWFAWREGGSTVGRMLRAGVVFLATFVSLSVGALVAFGIQAGLILWERLTAPSPNRWRTFAWLAAGAYVTLDLLSDRTPFHLVVDYATFNSGSAYNRILIFDYGMDSVWRNPIFGIGLNDWARPFWMGDSVDNFWLLVAMTYGVPAFLLLAGAFFFAMRSVSRAQLDASQSGCRAAWLVTLGGMIIAGGTVHYWHAMLTFFMFLLGAGTWMADMNDRTEEAGRRRHPTERTRPSGPRAAEATFKTRRVSGAPADAPEQTSEAMTPVGSPAKPPALLRARETPIRPPRFSRRADFN